MTLEAYYQAATIRERQLTLSRILKMLTDDSKEDVKIITVSNRDHTEANTVALTPYMAGLLVGVVERWADAAQEEFDEL